MKRDGLAFRFDARNHDYINTATGESYPHITGMLLQTGWVDDTWFTDDGSDRGTAVHRLAADYDLRALDVQSCVSEYRGYLLAHVSAVGIMQPRWLAIEEPRVHSMLGFGGRPDRDCLMRLLRAVWEIKSGQPSKADAIQTALQAILVAEEAKLPPHSIGRFCCYLKDNGKFRLEEHIDKHDFDEAFRVIKACTGL